ncbi:Hypothetical predicted protein [Olea europaea subsp. europaea]|uniref:Uncharacterized protein n=1 Tax=Olea europaea subsp. europaea TaxID=158383 RepID=A0A8S0VLQ9_OLEEU|nr:Hypothetical predicted protein [Olea europaea subsp. europaea]
MLRHLLKVEVSNIRLLKEASFWNLATCPRLVKLETRFHPFLMSFRWCPLPASQMVVLSALSSTLNRNVFMHFTAYLPEVILLAIILQNGVWPVHGTFGIDDMLQQV